MPAQWYGSISKPLAIGFSRRPSRADRSEVPTSRSLLSPVGLLCYAMLEIGQSHARRFALVHSRPCSLHASRNNVGDYLPTLSDSSRAGYSGVSALTLRVPALSRTVTNVLCLRYGRRQDQRLSATRCNERGTHLGHHTGSHRGRATTMLRLRQMSQSTSVVIPCSITNSKPVRTTANSALCMPLSVLYVAANYKIKAQTATRSQLSLLARDECETSLIH